MRVPGEEQATNSQCYKNLAHEEPTVTVFGSGTDRVAEGQVEVRQSGRVGQAGASRAGATRPTSRNE
jgi:hypothetical protein